MIKKLCLAVLIFLLVVGAGALGTLQLIAGTGQSQKKGLEGSFSLILQGTATLTKLHAFNILPQFNVDVEGLNVQGMPEGGSLSAEKLHIAFGLFDLLRGTKKIEVFSIKNMEIGKGVLSPAPFTIATAEILRKDIKGKEHQHNAFFRASGKITDVPFDGQIGMEAFETTRPSFAFVNTNPFTLSIGLVMLTGFFAPYQPDMKTMEHLGARAYETDCPAPENLRLSNKDFMTRILIPAASIRNKDDWMRFCKKMQQL